MHVDAMNEHFSLDFGDRASRDSAVVGLMWMLLLGADFQPAFDGSNYLLKGLSSTSPAEPNKAFPCAEYIFSSYIRSDI